MIIFLRNFLTKPRQRFKQLYFDTKAIKKNSTDSFAKLEFVVNKFNDIHIKEENLTKFVQQINSSQEKFENILKSNFLHIFLLKEFLK